MARPSDLLIRQQRILDVLQAKGSCTYKELQKLLDVSSMTVRRDIDLLAKREVLIKTLGGAKHSKVPQFLLETSISTRFGTNRSEKEIIAVKAMDLIKPHQTIFLDGSTTCIALARQIAKSQIALSVVTNSGIIAMEVGVSSQAKVVCIGGDYDAQSVSFVGALAESTCVKFFVDTAFISTKGFEPTDGTYESSLVTLRIKQLMTQQANKVVLLVDSSKFGQRSLCKVIDIREIHTVITDRNCPKVALKQMQERGRQVLIADGKTAA
jgi:DeoR family fructose operon transcriptional repressor